MMLGNEQIELLQFINVLYPEFVYVVFQTMGNDLFPNFFTILFKSDDFDEETYIVERGAFHSSERSGIYLEEGGPKLSQLIGIAILMVILRKLKDRLLKHESQTVKNIFENAWTMCHYNYFLAILYGDFAGLLLSALLQFEVPITGSFYTVLSFILGLATLAFYAAASPYLYYKMVYIHKHVQNQKEDAEHPPEVQDLMSKVELLYGDMKTESEKQFFFFFLMIADNLVLVLTMSYLQWSPVLQILLCIASSIGAIVLVHKWQPFKEETTTVLMIFNKASLGVMAAVASLLLFDEDGEGEEKGGFRYGVGATMVVLVAINMIVNLLLSFKALFLGIWKFLQLLKQRLSAIEMPTWRLSRNRKVAPIDDSQENQTTESATERSVKAPGNSSFEEPKNTQSSS